jgi:hypothetical protein
LIDAPRGGEVVIRGTILQKGPKHANPDVIGFAFRDLHRSNTLTLESNTIVIDAPKGIRVLHTQANPKLTLSRNIQIGGDKNALGGDTRWFADRKAAKYPPFPKLAKTVSN